MNRKKWLLLFAVISVLIIFPRVLRLDAFWAADEKVWVAHTEVFTQKLATLKWTQLMQEAHPGITLQWLGALGVRADSFADKKLPIVFGQIIVLFFIWYVFTKLWGRLGGVAVIIFLAVDPPLFAHMRVYEMESLLALFFVLSLGLLFLFQKTKAVRYLIFAAIAAALALLSKLPGALLVPISVVTLVIDGYHNKKSFKNIGIWLLAFAISAVVVFPSLVLDFFGAMAQISDFFSSDTFNEMHRMGPWYYLRTLVFYSTPVQILSLLALPVVLIGGKKKTREQKVFIGQTMVILLSAIIFVVMMSLGIKKGDRYILTAFLLMDVFAAAFFVKLRYLYTAKKAKILTLVLLALFSLGVIWQEIIILKIFPDNLAYLNPITKKWYGERRAGWGEGLEVAADYLNKKPNADKITVASYYPMEFGRKFIGTAVSANRYEDAGISYVVLYRAMKEREDAWETEAFAYFKNQTPEKVIFFNGVDFIWIYKK
jgi:hypothetical protein